MGSRWKNRAQRGPGVQGEECFFSNVSILNCVLFKEVMVSRLSNQFHQTNPAVSTPRDPTSERERGWSVTAQSFVLVPKGLSALTTRVHIRAVSLSGHLRAYAKQR